MAAQMNAPGAFNEYASCSHHTCTWVPWLTHKTFQQGDLSYTVEGMDKDENGGLLVLRRGAKELLRTKLKDLSASVSIVWSDDGRNLAITWSNGGASGGFDVRVFHVTHDAVIEWPAVEKAFSAFKARHWCETRGNNVQAYGWLPQSSQLILVLSVYPTSDCGKEMGHTEAYVVKAPTGDVLQHWDLPRLQAYIRANPEG